MWAEKWILGSIITGENVIADALRNVATRTSGSVDTEEITRLGAVYKVFNATFFKWPYVIMILAIIVIAILWKKFDSTHLTNGTIVILAFVGVIPFAWFFVTANHSSIHPRLVYRTFGITVFAWTVALFEIVNSIKIKFGQGNR